MPKTGHHFEDFAVGQAFATEARAVGLSEIDAFAELSGDRNPLHLDDAFARQAGFDGRIAHGVLGLAIATGLVNRLGLTRGTLLAFLGLRWDFVRPLLPDTRVAVRLRVSAVRPTSKPDRGIVVFAVALVDEDAADELQRGEFTVLVRRRRT